MHPDPRSQACNPSLMPSYPSLLAGNPRVHRLHHPKPDSCWLWGSRCPNSHRSMAFRKVSEEELGGAEDSGSMTTTLRQNRTVGPSPVLGDQGASPIWTLPSLHFTPHSPYQHLPSCFLSERCCKTHGAPMTNRAVPDCTGCSKTQSMGAPARRREAACWPLPPRPTEARCEQPCPPRSPGWHQGWPPCRRAGAWRSPWGLARHWLLAVAPGRVVRCQSPDTAQGMTASCGPGTS